MSIVIQTYATVTFSKHTHSNHSDDGGMVTHRNPSRGQWKPNRRLIQMKNTTEKIENVVALNEKLMETNKYLLGVIARKVSRAQYLKLQKRTEKYISAE
tara:strand:+ start:1798 stop:2094 length:297 start_codon:yes stop_codon:yes gene_type:complete